MGIALPLIGIFATFVSQTHGLRCYNCSDFDYDGENGRTGNCFRTVAAGSDATRVETCAADTSANIYYCETQFTIRDGVITTVRRGCRGSGSDVDVNSNAVPVDAKCTTRTNSNPTAETQCYHPCVRDNCNSVAEPTLRNCSTNCSYPNGRCDYIAGNCVCSSGYNGSDCTAPAPISAPTPPRRCLQCNSLTDVDCSSSVGASDCPSSQTYCASATTAIIGPSDNVIRTVVVRGCSNRFSAVDECSFTNIFTDPPISDSSVGYTEFTCYSTCDTDGCNTNSADGVINGNEKPVLQCVQCSDLYDSTTCNFQTSRTPCPSSATHCKSSVTYMVSNRTDLSHSEEPPEYRLVSVIRECATEAVETQCVSSKIGSLSLEKVTCEETCQTDGCNTGWPARPRCIQCSSRSIEYDPCYQDPPEPSPCSYPYQEYCVIRESGIEKGTRNTVLGYPHSISRGCSYRDIGNGCSSSTPRSTSIEKCNRTCTTDGCNAGSGSFKLLQTLAAVMAPALLAWLSQAKL